MQHKDLLLLPDYALFVVVAEVTARRRISAAYTLRSGAMPVLAAVGAIQSQGLAVRPAGLHAAGLMSASLLRAYLRDLCQAGLLERFTQRGRRYVRLLPKGCTCLANYQRHIRAGIHQYYTHTRIS